MKIDEKRKGEGEGARRGDAIICRPIFQFSKDLKLAKNGKCVQTRRKFWNSSRFIRVDLGVAMGTIDIALSENKIKFSRY